MTQWILTSCLLIAAVLVLRAVGRNRLSARVRYALWLLVLVRLLMPFSIGESPLSLMNFVPEEEGIAQVQTDPVPITDLPHTIGTYDPSDTIAINQTITATEPTVETETHEPVHRALNILWFAGCAMTAAILLSCNLRLNGALKRSRKEVAVADCKLPVYETAVVETPCMFGLLRPAIYLIPELTEDEEAMGHVLAHEQTHFRHLDHIWALLRCVCLAVHWYNPLVWAAAYLSREDGELACDEGTLRRLGEDKRTAYGETLIALTCTGHSGLMTTATTMTGSKGGLKERIKRIADRRKGSLVLLILVLMLAAVAAVALFTGQRTDVGVNGVWRTTMTVLGVDVTPGTEGWLEYEFKDGSGRMLMYRQGELLSASPVGYTIEGETLYLTVVDEKTDTGDVQEYTWSRDRDTLTLSASRGDIVFEQVEREYPKFMDAEGYVQIESLWQSSTHENMKAELTELEEARLLALLREGEAVKQNGAALVGDESLYYIFIRMEDGNLAITMANDLMGVEGGVYRMSNVEEIRANMESLHWRSTEKPEDPQHALDMTANSGNLVLGLNEYSGGEFAEVAYYNNIDSAVNAEHYFTYCLKPLAWTEIKTPDDHYPARWSVTMTAMYWSLTAYQGSDYVKFQTAADGDTEHWYTAEQDGVSFDLYSILRQWYDEMEAAAQPEIVIPNEGQTYLEAAVEYLAQLDTRALTYTSGSKYCFSFSKSVLQDGDFVRQQTETMRANGELSENAYCFYFETVFEPENEAAVNWNMAGNTADYTGDDPEVPRSAAFQRSSCGIIELQDDGWHVTHIGTSW